jgi:hypothetical protein
MVKSPATVTNKPGLREFISAITADTLAAACGVLSVPFAALAAYMTNPPVKVLFSVLAVSAFLTACYKTWSRERQSRCDTEFSVKKLAAELRDEQDRHPRPELFLQETLENGLYDSPPGFNLLNRGSASAVWVSFTQIQFGSITVTPGTSSEVIHAGEQTPVLFMFDRKEHGESLMPAWGVKEVIQTLSPELEAVVVERDLHITYKNTDNRIFGSVYSMQVDSIAQSIRMTFRELLQYPADTSRAFPLPTSGN